MTRRRQTARPVSDRRGVNWDREVPPPRHQPRRPHVYGADTGTSRRAVRSLSSNVEPERPSTSVGTRRARRIARRAQRASLAGSRPLQALTRCRPRSTYLYAVAIGVKDNCLIVAVTGPTRTVQNGDAVALESIRKCVHSSSEPTEIARWVSPKGWVPGGDAKSGIEVVFIASRRAPLEKLRKRDSKPFAGFT